MTKNLKLIVLFNMTDTKSGFLVCQDGTFPSLGEYVCHICYTPLEQDTIVRYQHDDLGPICIATQICGDCLESMLESQNQQFGFFTQKITDLQNCSKLLKSLLAGTYGIPTRLHDLVIFPHPEELVIPNSIDPEFGRKNEVARLWIGQRQTDCFLEKAPANQSEIHVVLREIIDNLESKIKDYDSEEVASIKSNLEILKKKIQC